QPMAVLGTTGRNDPSTLVIVGYTRRPFAGHEIRSLLSWVNNGGRLVLIDRQLNEEIAKAIAVWQFTFKTNDLELTLGSDPSDQRQMTEGMPASRPVQPTVLTANVNAVQTSKFASHIEIAPKVEDDTGLTFGGYQLSG